MKKDVFYKVGQLTVSAIVLASSQNILAHTRMEYSTVVENTKSYNAMVTGHGCKALSGSAKLPVIATNYVFPDGTDSTVWVGLVKKTDLVTDDVISWGGLFSFIPSREVYNKNGINWGRDATHGDPVGGYQWDGSLGGDKYLGLNTFRMSAAVIPADSCAKSVTFQVAAIDVCKITTLAAATENTLNVWAPAVGSVWDHAGSAGTADYNSPATYKITRDTDTNPIPVRNGLLQTCGAGFDYIVKPSAVQLNHDLPIPGVYPKSH